MNEATLNERAEKEIARRWSVRRDPALVILFNQRREASRRVLTRYVVWTALAIYVSFAIADYFLIPDVFVGVTATRFLLGFLTGVTFELMFRRSARADTLDDITGLWIIGCYGGWLLAATQTGDVETLSYYLVFGAMFMMVTSLFFDFPTHIALRTCFALLGGSLASVYWLPGGSAEYLLVFTIFYICTFIAISYVNWKLERERYQVFLNALQAELRQKEVERRGKDLLELSMTDPLTGLLNRRAIDERLETYWKDWKENGKAFAVFLIDVDYFKPYNDHYGHQEGDQCLVRLAEVFRSISNARECTAGRYGGEEFILLARADDTQSQVHLGETVRHLVEELGLLHEKRPDGRKAVTISIGLAASQSFQSGGLEEMILKADRALYLAKDNGRNRLEMFDPSNAPAHRGSDDIAALLDRAVDSGLVSLIYQPIFDTQTGETVALEALMRLEGNDGETIQPNVFIPIAESTGHIVSIGRWGLLTACRDVLAADRAPMVSVNVSVIQLKTPGFALYTAALLGRLKIDPARLALEITESHAIDDHAAALTAIGELKRIGVKIWLDDFGSGYAGLSWLKKVDFDFVKLDRSFLREAMTIRDHAMLSDLIRLIRHRGHDIIVEGVETQEQMEMIADYSVPYAQGYHLCEPATLSDLAASGAIGPRSKQSKPESVREISA